MVTNEAVAELVTNPNCVICNELDTVPADTVGLFSNVVTLVLNEADGSINEPLIPTAVNDLINVAFDPNDPLILDALNTGLASNAVVLVAKEEDVDPNAPDISVAI